MLFTSCRDFKPVLWLVWLKTNPSSVIKVVKVVSCIIGDETTHLNIIKVVKLEKSVEWESLLLWEPLCSRGENVASPWG